jgi:hypothetical protein
MQRVEIAVQTAETMQNLKGLPVPELEGQENTVKSSKYGSVT